MRYLLIILILCLGIQGEKYDISLKLQEDQVYYQTIRTESDFLMVMHDQEMPVSTILEARLSFKVLEVHDDHFDIQVQYERIWMKNKAPMATMEYSSDSGDTSNMMSSFLRGMIHKAFGARMSKQGKIIELQNVDTLFAAIWNGKAAEMIESKKELNEMVKEKMGKGLFMENFDLFSSFYPDREVAEGDSWSNTALLGEKIGGSTINTFSLIGLNDGNFIIEGESETYTKDAAASIEVMGKSFKYDLDGGMVFEGVMDAESGWIKDAIIKQEFKGEIALTGEDGNSMNIPIVVKNVITITDK